MSKIVPRDLEQTVRNIVHDTPALDVWSDIRPAAEPSSGRLDRLLTQPELLDQYRQVCGAIPDGLSIRSIADHIWSELFVRRSPISEHCRVVLTTLNRVGMREQVQARSLEQLRDRINQLTDESWMQTLMDGARLESVSVDSTASAGAAPDGSAHIYLNTADEQTDFSRGGHCTLDLKDGLDPAALDRLLSRAAERRMTVVCEVHNPALLPLIGPRPGLRWVLSAINASIYPMLTHVAGSDVRISGRWMSAMHQVYELTRTHMDMFGTGFIHGYSRSRVPEHLVGRWVHLRSVLVNVLCEKYRVLIYTGWNLTAESITADVQSLLRPSLAAAPPAEG